MLVIPNYPTARYLRRSFVVGNYLLLANRQSIRTPDEVDSSFRSYIALNHRHEDCLALEIIK